MEDQNIQFVKDCIEQVSNAKRFDIIYDYYSPACVFHTSPYVGLGIFPDDTSGEVVIIKDVAEIGPAAGLVQVGDELVAVIEPTKTWQGYDQLHSLLWGRGKLGTPVILKLLRDGREIEISLTRGRVVGFDSSLEDSLETWKHTLLVEIPDFKSEIQQIMASGDLVAYYAINSGTHKNYNQSAVWGECALLRLENGKIVEWWGEEDVLSQRLQFGFHFSEPG